MSDGHRLVVRNASWLAGEQFVGLATGLVVGVFVATRLGPDQQGVLAYSMAAVGLVMPALVALHPLMIRRLSMSEASQDYLRGSMAISAIIGIVGFAVVGLLAAVRASDDPDAAATTLVAGIPLLAGALMIGIPLLIAGGQGGSLARLRMSSTVVLGSIKTGLAVAVATALAQQVAMAVAGLVTTFLIYWLARRSRQTKAAGKTSPRTEAHDLLKEGWPFIVSSVAIAVFMSSDLVLLGLMATNRETGQYSVAVRFLAVTFALPVALVTATAPSIAQAKASGESAYWERQQRLASYSVAAAIGTGIISLASAAVITEFVLGSEYHRSFFLLIVMLPSCVFVALGTARVQWIVNEGHAKFALVATVGGAVLNVGLNVCLIPLIGAWGAAVSTVTAYFFSYVLINLLWRPAHPYLRIQLAAFNPKATLRIVKFDLATYRGSRP